MSFDPKPVLDHVDAAFDASVERVCELLRIPSISTNPQYADETRRCAEWLAEQLRGMGFEADARQTAGHPMVVAHDHSAGGGAPRILYYGHYDVQPPDPLELWETGPFEPTIVDGPHGKRVVARGAVDDKGQLMTFIEAIRAWKAVHGELPVNVSIILEGEEESGSPSLDPFLEQHRDELAADVCIVCDTGMWDIQTPAITTMLRGLVYTDITLHGPSHDLHSGAYGGAIVNPINALARIIGELHDATGRVRIPGFYDDVMEVTGEQREQWRSLGFDEQQFLQSAGLTSPHGEHGYSTLERIWARPTCDVNGIWGGYIDEGAKTVIASRASAKVSCRLVADQNPQAVYDGLVRFLHDRTPPGFKWEIHPHGMSPAIRVPTDSPYLEAARQGLGAVFDRDPVLVGTGGSIPVVGSIKRILGFDSLLVGFGLDDDRMHSPNEKFELRCLHNGIRSHAAILAQLAAMPTGGSSSSR